MALMISKVKNVMAKLSHAPNTTTRNHHGIESSNIGCHVKTPNTSIMAPNVVYQSKIPQRVIKSPLGHK